MPDVGSNASAVARNATVAAGLHAVLQRRAGRWRPRASRSTDSTNATARSTAALGGHSGDHGLSGARRVPSRPRCAIEPDGDGSPDRERRSDEPSESGSAVPLVRTIDPWRGSVRTVRYEHTFDHFPRSDLGGHVDTREVGRTRHDAAGAARGGDHRLRRAPGSGAVPLAAAPCRVRPTCRYSQWGCYSLVQWLGWHCGARRPRRARASPGRARAAKRSRRITEEFAAGRLSYSKVRALTRVATPMNEGDLVMLARACDRLTGRADRVRVPRRAQRRATEVERRTGRWRQQYLRTDWEDDGTMVDPRPGAGGGRRAVA